MSNASDKTIVQRSAIPPQPEATVVQSQTEAWVQQDAVPQTVVAGTDPAGEAPANVASVCEGMILKQRFELVELLGSGGMGAVFKARDLRQVEAGDADPWVAVKVINQSFSRHEHALLSLQQETKKTQRLSHPNIVSAYDFDRDANVAFMTMELLQGQSLDQLLRLNKSGLSASRALHIARQITEAVAYAHQQGVVHADLKPANIFVTQGGQVKVLDFGIARAIHAESSFHNLASIQAYTPAYASAAVLGGAPPEPKDDLYGLGCILYMLFTGEHPYRRCTATEAEAAAMKAKPIAVLNRSQWRALSLLLAFKRQGDLDVNDFRSRFFAEQSSYSKRIAIASVGVLLLVIAGLVLVNWFNHREHRAVIALLSSNSTESFGAGVLRLTDFSDDDKIVIVDGAREAVLSNLQSQVTDLAVANDYQQLQLWFGSATLLYPDSSALMDLEKQYGQLRNDFIIQLAEELVNRIDQRRYQDTDPDFSDLLRDLSLVEPQHKLFTEYDFKSLLAREAGLAMYLGHRDQAAAIVEQAVKLYPDDKVEFRDLLSRSASPGFINHGLGSDSNAPAKQWLADYRKAVDIAQSQDLADPEQLEWFLGELRLNNPGQYQVLASSLRHYLSQNSIREESWQAIKKSLTPEPATTRQARRRDTCLISLANRGADSRYHCRDSLTSMLSGPEMVVIKGDRSHPAFAVSRMEVSVADYNHYCRLYGACTPKPNLQLPVTSISYAEAAGYVQWLSAMSGFHYRLPNLKQWRLMALDDSGVRDHNCRVFTGGRWIRGGALRTAGEGYQNSLGLKNLFGNAGEWIRSGKTILIAGGDAGTELDRCGPGTILDGGAEASPMVGFRVVRMID